MRRIYTYVKNDEYVIKIEMVRPKGGGPETAFLHLDVEQFNKTVFKKIRQNLEDIRKEFLENGIEVVSFYIHKDITTKFHNMLRPLDFCVPMIGHEDQYLVGGWYTFEVNNGH